MIYEDLKDKVERNLTIREMAEESGKGQTTIRYWLKKHGLKQVRGPKGLTPPELRKRDKNKKNNCPSCGKIKCRTSNRCNTCVLEDKKIIAKKRFLSLTFGEIKKGRGSHHYYAYVRKGARRYCAPKEKVCQAPKCGYDFYVELCHIRPISDFPDSATMAKINAPDNLVYLCPNHHKEQEAGVLLV